MKLKITRSISLKTLGLLVFVLLPFIAGLIHPLAAFFYYGLTPLLLLLSFIIFIVSFIKFLRMLFNPTDKRFKQRLINLSFALLFWVSVPFWGFISFAGLIIHYEMFGDFKQLKTWAEKLDIHEELLKQLKEHPDYPVASEQSGIYYDSFMGLPGPASNFHPIYVHVSQTDNQRYASLSWSSGMMEVDWSLVLLFPETSKMPYNRTLTYELEPGIYLCLD